MSERPENEGRDPSGGASGEEQAARLHSLEARLLDAERSRAAESEELVTRMGAIEVLIDHLNGRISGLAQQAAADPGATDAGGGLELRVGGLEHALDAMGPLVSVPATISALEAEIAALGTRLESRGPIRPEDDELLSREIEARVSIAESRLAERQGAAWEQVQEAVNSIERRSESARVRLEERLAEQAATAAAALTDLERRLSSSLEGLTIKLGATTGASGDLAMQTVGRLETLEQDIVAIEGRFKQMARQVRPGDPITAVADAAEEAARIEVLPEAPAQRPSQGSPSPAPAQADDADVRLDVNAAGFDALRSLGCSVTQTARILSARKMRGGFGSLDELREVPGLPQELLAALTSRLRV